MKIKLFVTLSYYKYFLPIQITQNHIKVFISTRKMLVIDIEHAISLGRDYLSLPPSKPSLESNTCIK